VFGRLPRAAPDLTNSIVALVREAQAQVDQNMVSAWKGGGKVDGKGVDDDRLLKHLKSRRDQISPDDPAWDDWNNNFIQYDFAINESKMALKNDQGKISDGEMAAFYRKWAGREDVQKDSEFYRSLLSRAAKWNAAAKQRSAGNGARAAAEAHANWANGYYKDHVQGAETANGYLLAIAQTYGAAPPSANSLDDIDPNSVAYGKFMDVIEDGKSDDPNVQGLIDEMTRQVQKTNPNFAWSQSNLNDLLDRGDRGLKRLGSESTSDTERGQWAKRRETLRYEKTRVRQAAANERIQIASDTYANDLDACAGNPYCARNVTQKYRDKLQGEVTSVVAGAGIRAAEQDTKAASALVNTIEQLNDVLAGKDIKAPTAAQLASGEGKAAEGYTIFDAAAGRDTPSGRLAEIGNGINADRKMLDAGGWIMTSPKMQDGQPVVDGQGRPLYDYVVYDASAPKPAGAIAVPGVTLMTDQTRAATGPEGPTPVTVTPVSFVQPATPNVIYQGPDGRTIDPRTAQADIKLFDGETEAPPPWVELRGVKGPDGTARTVYQTGDGTAEHPYLFHDQPPVTQGMTANAAGQFTIPTTVATDKDGKPFLKADIAPYVVGVTASRTTLNSGAFVQGTYGTSGAALTSLAIRDLYAGGVTGDRDERASVHKQADAYLTQFQRGMESLPETDPNRIAAQRDYGQLSQTLDLYRRGAVGKMLDDAYTAANARDPRQQQYLDELGRAGVTEQRYGTEEVNRRISLLTGIADADARLVARRGSGVPTPMGGVRGLGLYGQNAALSGIAKEQEALAGQRKDVFNPAISVSGIKVPGMPTLMQQGAPATGFMGLPGKVYTQQPFPPATPRVLTQGPNGPSYKPPAGGFVPPPAIKPPTQTSTTPDDKKKDDYVPPPPPKTKPYEPPPPASKTTQHIL
jgi:hypothetical protein